MDDYLLYEEVCDLEKQSAEYDRQLKMCGVDLSDLPHEIVKLLDELFAIKEETNLHSLEMSFIDEFYFTKLKEEIEKSMIISKMKREIENLKKKIRKENEDITVLQEFANSVSHKVVSNQELDTTQAIIEKKIVDLQNRTDFRIPEDINLDELLSKIEDLRKASK